MPLEIIKRILSSVGGRSPLKSRLEELLLNLHVSDVYLLSYDAIQIISDNISGSENFKQFNTIISDIVGVKESYALPAPIYAVLDLISRRLEKIDNSKGFNAAKREAMETVNIILNELNYEIEDSKSNLLSLIGGESSICIGTYNSIILDALRSKRSSTLNVIAWERFPFLDGRRAARELKRSRFKSFYVPDINLHWAINSTDVIIVPFYSVEHDNIIVDAGSRVPVLLAKDEGVKTIAVGLDLTLYTAGLKTRKSLAKSYLVDVSILPGIDSKDWSIRISLFERLSIREIDYIVVSSQILKEPDETSLYQTAERLIDRVEKAVGLKPAS